MADLPIHRPPGKQTAEPSPEEGLRPRGLVRRLDGAAAVPDGDDGGRVSSPDALRPGTEERLAGIWQAILHVDQVPRGARFFDMGGHSLHAMRLVAEIQRQFGIRLPVQLVFEHPEIADLAATLEALIARGSDRPQPPPQLAAGISPERLRDPDRIPALPAQRGMWLLDSIIPDRATYNQSFAFRAGDAIDWGRFRLALRRTLQRHPALRSGLINAPNGLVQQILPAAALELPWSEEPTVDASSLERALELHARVPFDLATAPLWRATLFPAAAPHGVLLLTFHHAIIDEWSIHLLLRELARPEVEETLDASETVALAPAWLPEPDAAERDRCARFWREELAGADGDLPWPRLGSRAPQAGPVGQLGGLHRFDIAGNLREPLLCLARETGATAFQVFLAAFHAWLHRVTGSDDVIVGTPVTLRCTLELQKSVNCYLNTLPVRVRWNDASGASREPFTELVSRVRKTFLAAVGQRGLPFDEIVLATAGERTRERKPIVNTLFVFTPARVSPLSFAGVAMEPVAVDTGTSKFDLTLFLEADGEGLRGAFEYDRRLFDDATIAAFGTSFSNFLRSLLDAPSEPVSRARLLDEQERQRLIVDGALFAEPSAHAGSLIERFRKQVAATPDAAAVTSAGGTWSYRDLDEHASRLAARLCRAGVAADKPVAIYLPRSLELPAAILGVLAAGSGYVPLDPTLPIERLATMVAIAGCGIVVTDGQLAALVATLHTRLPPGCSQPATLRIDIDEQVPDQEAILPRATRADQLAYLLFTSGSTGTPKGVEMPVGPLENLIAWQCRLSAVGGGARTLQFASAGFDVSFQEMFSTWLSGGELVIVPEEARLDPVVLLTLVIEEGVERVFLPVAVLEHLALAGLATGRIPSSLREVIVAGEQLRIGVAIREFFAMIPGCILWNQYGPTESHVVASHLLTGSPAAWPDLPPIGCPIAGALIRLLDPALEPVPVGVAGEIWIGGICLARGYAGRADLTAERFVADPFATEPGGRLYRSGDVGRWRADGLLEYLGRADRQVKIRGHRVEPDEVEVVLAGYPGVAEAAVVARQESAGDWSLVAYVVPAAGRTILLAELKTWLAARLSAAMIPERIGILDALPLTLNGKIDRGQLERFTSDVPVVGVGDDPVEKVPLKGHELAIAELWREVLGRGLPGRDDDFFSVGGMSLAAMRLVARARERFGCPASVRDVFDHPTVAGLAARWLGAPHSPPESTLLSKVADAPDVAIDSFDLLSDAERHRVTFEFNDTAVDLGPLATLHSLVAEQARRTPGGVALWCEGLEVSFAELDASSDRLAGHLASLGVGAGGFVGVFLERSIEFVVAVLGILKAGCGYAPLPADHPAERIAFMIEDADLTAIVTCRGLASLLPVPATSRVLVDADEAWWHQEHLATGLAANDGAKAAYVMYTSGSTGRPKGVVVPHRAVVRLVRGQSYADFGPELRTLLLAPTAFDASTFELWSPLLSGGTCVIFRDRMPGIMRLAKVVREGRVNCLWLTASLFNHVIDGDCECLATVGHVITGGEALSIAHVRRALINLPGIRLSNGYGPTEATTFTSMHAIDPHDAFHRGNVPIGRPLANTTCYVVDDSLRLVGVGVTGELLIGGDGLALGYLGQPELTAEKFIPDPFGGRPSARLYRTGDMCRWMEDGNLEYLGRRDQQVKIRGYRIELAEIEAELARIEGVARAVVIDREVSPGDRRLVAYLVTEAHVPDDDRLRALLAARLPEVMVPWRFLRLDAFPITANGKLDRGALPLPDADREGGVTAVGELLRGPTETAIAALWSELLGVTEVGRDDRFFDLGGHSLLAMRLVSAIQQRLGVRIPLRTVFDRARLADLAQTIDALATSVGSLLTAEVGGEPLFLPALPAQRGMWLLQELLPDPATYNQPFAFRPTERLDWESFQVALAAAMERHPALRASLVMEENDLVQRHTAAGELPLPWSEDAAVGPDRIEATLVAHARLPFDLTTAPLWRATLFPAAALHGVLLLTFHHAVIDDWSIRLLLDELFSPRPSESSSPSNPPLQRLSPEAVALHQAFWAESLAGAPPAFEWPEGASSPAEATGRGGLFGFAIPAEVVEAWRRLARRERATLFHALLGAFHVWLQRVGACDDTVVLTPVAGRDEAGVQSAVGCFLNTLPVRLRRSALGGGSAAAVVRATRDCFLELLEHAALPFDAIVASVPGSTGSRLQSFGNVMFVLLEEGWGGQVGVPVEPIEVHTGTARFDLTLSLVGRDFDGGLDGTVEYALDVLDETAVRRMVERFLLLLQAVADAPDVAIDSFDLLSDADRHRVTFEFNDTAVDLGPLATLHSLVAEQARRTPGGVAVEFAGESLTYSQLWHRATRLACLLRERGVGPDVAVGICAERSLEMVVGLLGILVAGGAYLPLDHEYPAARLAKVIAVAGVPIVLAQRRFAGLIPASVEPIILDAPDASWNRRHGGDDAPPVDASFAGSPSNLAYVIFTSGSTGEPKGVMNTHAGIVNRLRWMQVAYGIEASDRVLQKTPFGFDVSVWEFFWPLLTGARLVVAPPGLHRDPQGLAETIAVAGITVVHFVPSMLEAFLEIPDLERSCRSLRHVVASGEALGEATARECLRRIPARLHNLYGPTEAAVDVTFHECRADDPPGPVPIGRPIANMRTYLLDAAQRPVGVGMVGELWLAGIGVARGYIARPELTAERFLPDPFADGTMYRTGDLARWRADGEIEYLGRIDHQVKVRGIRIELGEIEAEIERLEPGVRGVVVAREDWSGDVRLVAYVVGSSQFAEVELRERLGKTLPPSMVPWRVLRLDSFPVTANGKLDRGALPLPDAVAATGDDKAFSAPFGEVEEGLAAIWCELLGIPSVGRNEGFFELGGHSLLAMRLVAAVERRFGVRLPLRSVFESPRLADIATRIAKAPTSLVESKVSFATIPAGDSVVNCSPLPAQRGMWLLDALLPDRAASNVPLAWRVVGMIDWPRMERALLAVAARHPGLRTGLVEVDGELVQRVLPAAQAAVAWREIAVAAVESLPAALCEEARIPFDLAVAPLLRGVRFNVEGADPVLMITFHHAVFDEWSAGVLRDDLAVAYLSDGPLGVGSLPIVTVSHAPEKLDQQRTFWREELASAPPETPLPRTSLVTPTTKGRTHRFGLDGAAVDRLRTLSSASGVTLFNFLLASCHAWVQRVTGENDIVIGTPVATRGASDTAAAVGCLINVLPIRVRWDIGGVTSGVTMGQLAARVQEIFLRALDHADLPFHQIVAAAVQERRGNRQPLVNILFTLVETGNRVWRVGPAALHPLGVDTGISRFDLSLTVEISPHGMECALEASADLLDQDTVAGLASRYEALLLEMLAGPMVPVERMEMLSVGERRLVIDQWNSTTVELGSPATLHQLVAEQAAKTPAAVAVRDGGQAVTYAQLELRAAQLASRLRARGIGSGMRVGIAVPRSIEAVVSVLGILRSGAAWVPLDRNWPPARLAMIAADAGLAAIIDCGESSSPWPVGMAILDPSGLGEADWDGDDAGDVDPRAPAYVMYTSGSTGHPKGVVIPHAAAVNYLRGKQHRFPLEATDVVLHSTGTTFDISLYELFGPLLAGASVVIAPPGRSDPFQIAHLVRGAGVTVAQFVPSLLGILVEDETFTSSPTLRRVFCGGEAMPPLLMRMFLDRSAAELVNVYGPTEATVWATAWVCQRNDHDRSPPIGRPLDNVRCYVLDSAARPVPSGVVGELYIGGEQLAVGYHDRPELTAERFLPDPHCGRLGGRMYRTGDACLWRKDGQLEFIARTDQQVKIRGHRIELGEIEACLAGHPAVAGVAVVVVGDTPAELGGLTACVVARDATPAAEDLRRWTAERLPEAMVPTRFVGIAALPLNTNGKIDRPALAQLARTAPTGIPPRGTPFPERLLTGLETEIRAAWQRVFGRIDIGPDDDFFAIGGHSLVALRLVAGLGATLGRRVPVSLVFEAPTVVAQARALGDGSWKPRYDSLVPMQPLGDGPAVFFIHGVMGGVSSYLEIARELAPEIPVYGLQAIDRDGHHPQHPTAEAMVEHYATEIRSFQPCGPYVVTGFCAGGWLAYGVARELRKRGDEVRLVLLETHGNCRVTWRAWWRWMSRLVPELVVKHTRRLGRLSVAQWPRYLLDRILPMMGLRPGMARGPIPADRQERPATPEEQVNADPYLPAITRLRIDPVDFDIVHIGVLGELASSAELFRGLTTGTCTACRLPGTHHEILRHPNAVAVAAIFRRCLLDAAARSDSAGPSRS